ncbi:MAG: hypothetical protein ACW964_17340, partial [Candidatus Hodarchaeales archaeon]
MKRTLIYFLILLLPILILENVYSYPRMLQSNNEPDLTLIDSILVDDQPGTGVVHFNATIRNSSSAPATTGTVPISWEKVRLGVPLSGGIGVINETTTDLDLNGDGDKIDTLSVT